MASKLKDFENAEKKGAPLSSIEYNSFSFYEINGKIRWRLSSSSSLAFTFFISDDWIKNYGQENYEKEYSSFRNSLKNERYKDNYCIGNKGLSLTHVKNFGSLFWKNTFSMSDYNTESDNLSDEDIGKKSHVMYKTKIITEIKDITYQSRIEYNTGIHKVKSGIEINHYNFNPGFKVYEYDVDTISSDVSESGYHTNSKAWENSFYINDEIGITDNYSLECGVRTTLYHISNFNYKSFEPRISMRYLLSNNLSLKMNYTSMSQYNHVMVNNNNGAEEEVWIASTKGVKPQKANQVSVGLFYGNDDKRVNMSVEAYYKQMKDLIEYRSLYDEEEQLVKLEDAIFKGGKGIAYGIETFVSKDFSNLSLSLSYTLSKNKRQFNDLNGGKWFPFVYDRTHDLSLIVHYRFNKKWTIDGNFVYSTGRPCTLPIGEVPYCGILGSDHYVYGETNSYRMPDYHRFDLGVKRYFETQRGLKSQLTMNIYNVYARQNATAVYYREGVLMQSCMFTIIPTISYTIML